MACIRFLMCDAMEGGIQNVRFPICYIYYVGGVSDR